MNPPPTASQSLTGSNPRLAGLATAVPPRRWDQREVYDLIAGHFESYRDRRRERVFLGAGVEHRHLAFEPAEFDPEVRPAELHARFSVHSLGLSLEAARSSLERAGLTARDVDVLVVATCTGYLCPGLTGQLARALGLRDDVQRCDQVGMGCAGALPALQRASDHVRAYPDRRVLVVCVEVCSACWYVDDDLETVVGNAICSDGAAALVVEGAGVTHADPAKDGGHKGPELIACETLLEPAFLDSVGLVQREGRLRIVLDKQLRHAAGPLSRRAVDRLLERRGLDRNQVDRWVFHSGGRRVLDSIDESLGFGPSELTHSREVLRNYGNMSSPTVLFVLERHLREAGPGELGVLLALGPGLAAETALLRF